MASSESTSGGDSALLSKLGGAIFSGSNSPQRVIANVRGILANRITGAIPDAGKKNTFSTKTTTLQCNIWNIHNFVHDIEKSIIIMLCSCWLAKQIRNWHIYWEMIR